MVSIDSSLVSQLRSTHLCEPSVGIWSTEDRDGGAEEMSLEKSFHDHMLVPLVKEV